MKTMSVNRKNIISILLMSMFVINSFISVPGLGILCAVVSLYFIADPEYLLPSLFVAAYLDLACFIVGNLTASRYLIIIFIIFVLLKKYREGSIEIQKNLLLYLGIFLIYIVFSGTFSSSGFTTSVFTMILNIAFAIMVGSLYLEDTDRIFGILQIGAFEIIIFLFANYFSGAAVYANGSYELLSGTNNNEVGMAMAQIGALYISSYMIRSDSDRKWKKILYMAGVVLSLILLFLTGSRSATFGLCVAIGIAFIYNIMLNGSRVGTTVRNLIVLIVVIVLGFYFLQGNELLSDRFTLQAVSDSGGSGRFEIWKCIWDEAIVKHPFFGIGYGGTNVQEILYANGIYHSGTHNILFDILATIGFVGTIYLSGGLVWLIRRTIGLIRYCPYLFCVMAMLLAGLANGVGENIYSERFLWMDIGMIICLVINTERRRMEDGYELQHEAQNSQIFMENQGMASGEYPLYQELSED